jgi:predicted ATPase
MLTNLSLKHFKCFELLQLPLKPLTLLSGTNAAGKSSVLQALVLLHQTMREHEWSTRLILNGSVIRLGTVADVVDKVHGRREFSIAVVDEEQAYQWFFTGDRAEMSMKVDRIIAGDSSCDQPEILRHLLPHVLGSAGSSCSLAHRLQRLTYITAERVGPREIYAIEDRQVATVVGPAGEHAVSVLHWGRDDLVMDELTLQGVPKTLLRQVEGQMRLFFPGCAIAVQQVPQANVVTLGLRTSDDTDFHRPIHAGFGLTQVLPIVIAALSSEKGDMLLIENPEVHLHPAGQALMGRFLGDVANAGVQVIVETHSDHVLNGVRKSVKAKQLDAKKVATHFFRSRSEKGTQVISPQLDSSGNLDIWPDGFFDQFDKDATYLAGWGE